MTKTTFSPRTTVLLNLALGARHLRTRESGSMEPETLSQRSAFVDPKIVQKIMQRPQL